MFKWLLNNSLSNRLLVILTGLSLMLYGAWVLPSLPVDVFPDLNKPTVTLLTEAGGMATEEVETQITFALETVMNGLPGVENIRSTSSAGLSFIYVTFSWQTDLYRARQMVAERLSSLESTLPAGIVPRMGPVTSVMGEILQIALPIQDASPMQVREYADWILRPRLLALPGVAQVIPIGGEVRQFQVYPNTARMADLGILPEQLRNALRGYAANTSGGFLEKNGREYLIRHLGRTSRLEDLQHLAVGERNARPILLRQVAEVGFGPAIRRGDAGFAGQSAVILGIQKQPGADTLALTRQIETALTDLTPSLPHGISPPRITFRQAGFIEAAIGNLKGKLGAASLCVAFILFIFLGTFWPTVIALTAIPVSILVTALVFAHYGLSINTMTLGGLAIAIGGLVDDALVDVENILRRLKAERKKPPAQRRPVLDIIYAASMEVRSGILYATVIVVLVFLPLFALPGMEGRLFMPLGIAFILSTLASLLVSVTLTPVLASLLLPRLKTLDHGDTWLLAWLKRNYRQALHHVLRHPRTTLTLAAVAVATAAMTVPFFPRTFLPPFNEGTLLVGLRLNPGTTLTQSSALARQAEMRLLDIPEIAYVGRRSGRAELDEHAEGVHVSELDVGLKPDAPGMRPMREVVAEIRARLAGLPAAIAIGQPISHRIDHMLSGVRAQIAIKIFGEDLDTLRAQAERLRTRLAAIPGLTDLEVEKQVLAPQIKIRLDPQAAAQYGVTTPRIAETLESLVGGETLAQISEGNRRFALVLRMKDEMRTPEGLSEMLLPTPGGPIPLSRIADIEESDGPNQISRDNGRRRIVLSANVQDRALSEVIADLRSSVADIRLPEGYFITLGGQFQAEETASRLIGLLTLVCLALMFAVLYSRYRSARLSLMIMSNIPLALVGAVIGLWLSGQPMSIAALIGFVTLAGISVRNGILKISHYLNLIQLEGRAYCRRTILDGSLDRLAPVLMTALVTAFALAPLLFEAEEPGTEILHPVAVVIFSGLISATLLDAFITPMLFWRYGKPAIGQSATRMQSPPESPNHSLS